MRNLRVLISGAVIAMSMTALGCSANSAATATAGDDRVAAYAFELDRTGESQRLIDETFAFRDGDGFRLRVRPEFAGYLYVFNKGTGESGYTVLFPAEATGVSNPLHEGSEQLVPEKPAAFRLDTKSGNESLVVVISSARVPELEFKGKTATAAAVDKALASVERDSKPEKFQRVTDGDWVKLVGSGRKRDIAFVVRMPLRHQ